MFVDKTGERRYPPQRSRKDPISKEQYLARRYWLWLHLFEVGIPDPVTKRVSPLSQKDIAGTCGVPLRTVQHGLQEARRLA